MTTDMLSQQKMTTDMPSQQNVTTDMPYVILETHTGEDCDGYVDSFKDFEKKEIIEDQPSNSEKQTFKENDPSDIVLEKSPPRLSQPSQSSPIKVSENTLANSAITGQEINWDEVIQAIDFEMERLGWDKQRGQKYILDKYGKKSRQVLSDRQLLEFLGHLKA